MKPKPATEHPKYLEAKRAASALIPERRFPARWIKTYQDVNAVLAGCWFDESAPKRVESFGECLPVLKGLLKGQPFRHLDWQRDDVTWPLFGWKRRDGTRRFREAYIEVPKKNGKSAYLSMLGCYMLTADGESAPEVYTVSGSRDQAGIIHDYSARLAKANPKLSAHLRFVDSRKTITYPARAGRFTALSADVELQEGRDWSCVLFDELHVQKTPRMYNTLRYGGIARTQPLLIAITTAGVYEPESIGWKQHDYASKVLRGIVDDWTFHAVIYAAEETDDYHKPAVWRDANPSLGTILSEDDFRTQLHKAEEEGELGDFLRYRLNIWTQTVETYFDMARWDRCGGEILEEELYGLPCYGGLDLSQKWDLTSWALVFPPGGGCPKWRFLIRNFLPSENIAKRSRRDKVNYSDWLRRGWLETTDGAVVDYTFVRKRIVDDSKLFEIREIGYDRTKATETASILIDQYGLPMVEVAQGTRYLSEPTKKLNELILTGDCCHGDNGALRWAASNMTVLRDINASVRPDKKRSTGRIDPVVAVIIAMSRAIVDTLPENEAPKVFFL